MKKQKSLTMPVIVIEPGKMPRVDSLVYEQQDREDGGMYEPQYDGLKTLLGDPRMVEHVTLTAGISLWCDEEGRLSDEAEASCMVDAPSYAGDIAGPCVIAIDTTRHPFDAFTKIDDDEARKVLALRLLFGFGKAHIGPPPEGHVLAEPSITIRCASCGDELVLGENCSCEKAEVH